MSVRVVLFFRLAPLRRFAQDDVGFYFRTSMASLAAAVWPVRRYLIHCFSSMPQRIMAAKAGRSLVTIMPPPALGKVLLPAFAKRWANTLVGSRNNRRGVSRVIIDCFP